jgi:pimeloyl-ACP methyl ester carboxylesterase
MDTFTIVAWDQRGSGGSYKGVDPDTLNIKQLTDDAHELVEYLCKRFNKDKIFIIGGSWGSELGTWLAYRYPKHIAAFVGFGQVVDGAKNEELSYNFAMEQAQKANDQKSIKILEEVGPPVDGIYKGGTSGISGMLKQREIMKKYGGFSPKSNKGGYARGLLKPMLFSGEYSISDIIGLIRGYKIVLEKIWPEVGKTNLTKSCPKFKMPYLIFDGVHDENTPAALVQDFFDKIKAPEKELVWFKYSGHNPMSDEPDKFKTLLRRRLTKIAEAEKKRKVKI